MFQKIKNIFRIKKKYKDIDPDEIFIDSKNLPEFDTYQFEGRIENPISSKTKIVLASFFMLIGLLFLSRVWNLEISQGSLYKTKSENNRLKKEIVFNNRGIIFDRNNEPLVWNDLSQTDTLSRVYATSTGLASVLGYVKYPSKDTSGNYYQENFVGIDGIEKLYNATLTGTNGSQLTETDAVGNMTSQSILVPPKDGQNITLSIDSDIQKEMYRAMLDFSTRAGYRGGAGVMINVVTGEMIALASFPEYDSNIMARGTDSEKIKKYLSDTNNPFLDRAVSGLYTPGSIVKPFLAMGALTEKIIDPSKQILSTGSISIPNPYDPKNPSIFKDWKALGYVDMRHALAMSSDVYFYEIGGGFNVAGQPHQQGLGIMNIEKYLQLFGFGQKTGIEIVGEGVGVIPDPEWKKTNFNGEDWRLGDTYNTSIGQYGLQITPLQAVRAVATVANGGWLLKPTILKVDSGEKVATQPIALESSYLDIVKEGMRLAVTEGTVQSLHVPYVDVSAKSGTAELGTTKSRVNSWVIGFFPSDHPRYAFAMVMEKGVANNQIGASLVMREIFDYMSLYKSEYFK